MYNLPASLACWNKLQAAANLKRLIWRSVKCWCVCAIVRDRLYRGTGAINAYENSFTRSTRSAGSTSRAWMVHLDSDLDQETLAGQDESFELIHPSLGSSQDETAMKNILHERGWKRGHQNVCWIAHIRLNRPLAHLQSPIVHIIFIFIHWW